MAIGSAPARKAVASKVGDATAGHPSLVSKGCPTFLFEAEICSGIRAVGARQVRDATAGHPSMVSKGARNACRGQQDERTKGWAASLPIGSSPAALRQRQRFWEPLLQSEPSLDEKPLVLLADAHAGVSAPEYLIWDESRRCFAARWAELLDREMRQSVFEALRDHAVWEPIKSKRGHVTRETCWYVREGCSCDYTYGSSRIGIPEFVPEKFAKAMEELLGHVCEKLCPWLPRSHWPNSANLNLYRGGSQIVGWHADDEALFGGSDSDCPIISISLGSAREFWIALKENPDSAEVVPRSIIEVDLYDGDVLAMEGLCQKHCLHFVPSESPCAKKLHIKAEEFADIRINVTWRWIRNHKPKCLLHVKHVVSSAPLFSGLAAASPKPIPIFQTWTDGRPVAYGPCDSCKHDAWRGGRPCVQHNGQWFCRLCWQYSKLSDNGRQALKVPGEQGCTTKSPERRPKIDIQEREPPKSHPPLQNPAMFAARNRKLHVHVVKERPIGAPRLMPNEDKSRKADSVVAQGGRPSSRFSREIVRSLR